MFPALGHVVERAEKRLGLLTRGADPRTELPVFDRRLAIADLVDRVRQDSGNRRPRVTFWSLAAGTTHSPRNPSLGARRLQP